MCIEHSVGNRPWRIREACVTNACLGRKAILSGCDHRTFYLPFLLIFNAAEHALSIVTQIFDHHLDCFLVWPDPEGYCGWYFWRFWIGKINEEVAVEVLESV